MPVIHNSEAMTSVGRPCPSPCAHPPSFRRMLAIDNDVEFTSRDAQIDLLWLFIERDPDGILDTTTAALKGMATGPAAGRLGDEVLGCIEAPQSPPTDPDYRRRPDRKILAKTCSHEPEDLTKFPACHGFHTIQSAHEGCLPIGSDAPSVAPIHAREPGVFETICDQKEGVVMTDAARHPGFGR